MQGIWDIIPTISSLGMRSSEWPALHPWYCNLGPEISDTPSVRGYVVPLSIWMLWGKEIFRAHSAVKEDRMKAARRAVSTSCDLVPTSNGFGLPTERQSTRHTLRTEEDSDHRRRSLLAHVFRNCKSIFRIRLWRISSIEWLFVLESRSTKWRW